MEDEMCFSDSLVFVYEAMIVGIHITNLRSLFFFSAARVVR